MTQYLKTKKEVIILEEIKRWIQYVLNVPSDHFNGLPPCPYAMSAWVNNDVEIIFGSRDDVLKVCDEWETQESSIVIVVTDETQKELSGWCEEQNDDLAHENLTLMSFVPDDAIDTGQPEEEMTNWEPLTEEEYSMERATHAFKEENDEEEASNEASNEASDNQEENEKEVNEHC